MDNLKLLQKRVLDISKRKGLSHIGSCLSVLPILIEIYENKKPEDIVILDGAHAHVAHMIVRDYYEKKSGIIRIVNNIQVSTDQLIDWYGIHCDRLVGCDASGGSLGHGVGISIGYALSNRSRAVQCVVTDGSMMEGSNWEALRIKSELKLDNLQIYCNFNGYTAVAKIDRQELINRMKMFDPTIHVNWSYNGKDFDGIEGHYTKLT